MVASVEFAKFILSRASAPGVEVKETKLHKLLYICDGYMLAGGVNLINERARAWNYGPVYPKVHRWVSKTPDVFTSPAAPDKAALAYIENVNAPALVDKVLPVYGNKTAWALSNWSLSPRQPLGTGFNARPRQNEQPRQQR